MRGSAWRRRREAQQEARRNEAIGEFFALNLQNGALGEDGYTAYHASCAPPRTRDGYGWAPEDARPCAGCGGPIGQPPRQKDGAGA